MFMIRDPYDQEKTYEAAIDYSIVFQKYPEFLQFINSSSFEDNVCDYGYYIRYKYDSVLNECDIYIYDIRTNNIVGYYTHDCTKQSMIRFYSNKELLNHLYGLYMFNKRS